MGRDVLEWAWYQNENVSSRFLVKYTLAAAVQ